MKRLVFLLLVLGLFMQAHAEETLLQGQWENGGFGGPSIKVTQLNGETVVLMGGRGGWIINHQLIIGGGGYGSMTSVLVPSATINGLPVELHFGYGGFEMEYIFKPSKLLHTSLYCLVGGGVAEYTEDDGSKWNDSYKNDYSKTDEIFVVEPAINGTLNVTSFFRISAVVSYRYVQGLDLKGLNNSDLSGLSAGATLRFGSF